VLLPALQYVLPYKTGGHGIELIAIQCVVAVGCDLASPLYRDLSVVQLVPTNLPLGSEQHAVGHWVGFKLVINGGVLSDGLEPLPVELSQVGIDIVCGM